VRRTTTTSTMKHGLFPRREDVTVPGAKLNLFPRVMAHVTRTVMRATAIIEGSAITTSQGVVRGSRRRTPRTLTDVAIVSWVHGRKVVLELRGGLALLRAQWHRSLPSCELHRP